MIIELSLLFAAYSSPRISPPRVSSPPRISAPAPRPSTPKATPSTPKTTPKTTPKSTTTPSKSVRNGRTYNNNASSDRYTNASGVPVWFWLFVAGAGSQVNNGDKGHYECYDKDYKRTTCNREKTNGQ